MIIKIFNNIKFFLSKINLYFRYKKKKIILGLNWIFFGKEISNFSYEIYNTDEILHLCNIITNIHIQKLDQISKEVNFENSDFKEFFSENFFQNYEAKNIFGRRLLWYILVRSIKPNLVIESGIDKGLGSTLLIYAQYKNTQEINNGDFEYIGTDIVKKKNFIFNQNNSNFKKYQFIFQDTLNFLKNFKDKKKNYIYI